MRLRFACAIFAVLGFAPMPALSDCSCLCVDGRLQAVCTASGEVAGNRGVCQSQAAETCPAAPALEAPASYEPPEEGVENCREAQVYDPRAGEYVSARVCDAKPAD